MAREQELSWSLALSVCAQRQRQDSMEYLALLLVP